MTIKEWKEKYYPTPAKRFADPLSKRAALAACKHSLKKWKGLTKSNRKNLTFNNCILEDPETFDTFEAAYSDSCSLCVNYDTPGYYNFYDYENGCELCPLFVATGVACYDDGSPYDKATDGRNQNRSIAGMVRALEKALEVVENGTWSKSIKRYKELRDRHGVA